MHRGQTAVRRDKLAGGGHGVTGGLELVHLADQLFFVVLGFGLAGIWGLTGAQIFAYITSVLTILGVAFFAQWSLLSNITSGLILFFNHPMKLGDYIEIVDKDFPMEGRVENITLFFLHLRNKDNQVYTFNGNTVTAVDYRLRQEFSTTVALRNRVGSS